MKKYNKMILKIFYKNGKHGEFIKEVTGDNEFFNIEEEINTIKEKMKNEWFESELLDSSTMIGMVGIKTSFITYYQVKFETSVQKETKRFWK